MNALRLNLIKLHDEKKDRPRKNKTVYLPEDLFTPADNKNDQERNSIMEKTVKIEGMMCEHCEMTVKKALEALPFIAEAKPSHEANVAVITLSGELAEAAVKKVIEDKDYTFAGIE